VSTNAEAPLLMVMTQKLLNKGLTVEVRDTHPQWTGFITKLTCTESSGVAGSFEVTVRKEVEGVEVSSSFSVQMPSRWKLAKDEAGLWVLWPPRTWDR
jgi:hypothetical protein